MNNLLIEAILRSPVTVQPLWVVLGCAQRWQAAQAPVNGGVPPRKVHGGGGVELPAGGDEGSGVVEGVVGAASHPADLVVDLSQIGQLKQEKRSAAQRSRQETDLNFTFRGLRCKHKGVAYAKISMVQSKTTNWFKCSCGSSCCLFGWLIDKETVESLVFHVRSRSHWQCQQKHTRCGHQRSWKTSECACGEGLCASLPCLGSDHL